MLSVSEGLVPQEATAVFLINSHAEDVHLYEEVKHDPVVPGDHLKNSIHDTSASESTRSEPILLSGEAVHDTFHRRSRATKIRLFNENRSKC